MNANTLKTTVGYLRSLIEKYSGLSWKQNSLKGIYNHHKIELGSHGAIQTSGQPTEKQLAVIKAAGTKLVINLAPGSAENSLADEADVVAGLGMEYVHMPVDFKAPSEHDYRLFVSLIEQKNLAETWVHCAANMRVSAFIYRYRLEYLNHSKAVAKHDMDVIWEPFGVWKRFVSHNSD